MDNNSHIYCIGIDSNGLYGDKLEIVMSADVVISPRRFMELLPDRCNVIDLLPLDTSVKFLEDFSGLGHAVVLASGDPLFFGIGRYLIKKFGPDHLTFLPALTCIQDVCSRMAMTWDDIKWVSLHGSSDVPIRNLAGLLVPGSKIAVLTDPKNSPDVIARQIYSHPASRHVDIMFHIGEDLGGPQEKIHKLRIEEVIDRTFHPLNILVMEVIGDACGYGFGLNEDSYEHQGGLITKAEVRAIALSKLDLPVSGIMWDIGAGSGAVSIEAHKIHRGLTVFAVEHDETRCSQIENNLARHIAFGVNLVRGHAPDVLDDLPDPDRIFLGGGIKDRGLLECLAGRLRTGGIMVVTCVLLESLNSTLSLLPAAGFYVELVEIQISRARPLGQGLGLKANNPVFLIRARKG